MGSLWWGRDKEYDRFSSEVRNCWEAGGNVVHEYNDPQPNDGTLLKEGTISIQAESHPIQFRKIELKVLKK